MQVAHAFVRRADKGSFGAEIFDRFIRGMLPISEEDFSYQTHCGTSHDGAKISPTLEVLGGAHVFTCQITSPNDRGVVVEDRDFTMIAQIGGVSG